MPKLSATIITLNEADNIQRCVASLLPLVDEVLVGDTGSQDNTIALAQEAGARVVSLTWEGYAKTKNQLNSLAQNDWIFSVDADEEVSKDLATTIQQLTIQPNNAYRMNRFSNYCGTWIKYSGWYPDRKVRIFNRQAVQWQGDFVHETLHIPSAIQIVQLKGDLLHYTYKSEADHLERVERYSTLSAQDFYSRQKKAPFYKKYASPVVRFLRAFIFKLGFLDGQAGWQIATKEALTVYKRYQKLDRLWKQSEKEMS